MGKIAVDIKMRIKSLTNLWQHFLLQKHFTYKTTTIGFERYLDLINDQMLKLVYQEESTKNIFNN